MTKIELQLYSYRSRKLPEYNPPPNPIFSELLTINLWSDRNMRELRQFSQSQYCSGLRRPRSKTFSAEKYQLVCHLWLSYSRNVWGIVGLFCFDGMACPTYICPVLQSTNWWHTAHYNKFNTSLELSNFPPVVWVGRSESEGLHFVWLDKHLIVVSTPPVGRPVPLVAGLGVAGITTFWPPTSQTFFIGYNWWVLWLSFT